MPDPTNLLSAGMSLAGAANPYVAVGQAALGAYQTATALNRLNKLNKQPWDQFSNNMAPLQQNVSMWQDRVNTGLPQSYINQAYNTNAQQTASAYRNIQDSSGGQMGTSFARIAALDRVRLGQNLAAMSDQARREAMGQLAGARSAVASQMNLQTQANRNLRMMQEQALGGALRAGTQNLASFVDYSLMPQIGNKFSMGVPLPKQETIAADVTMTPQNPVTPALPMGQDANLPSYPSQNYWGSGPSSGFMPIDPNDNSEWAKAYRSLDKVPNVRIGVDTNTGAPYIDNTYNQGTPIIFRNFKGWQ